MAQFNRRNLLAVGLLVLGVAMALGLRLFPWPETQTDWQTGSTVRSSPGVTARDRPLQAPADPFQSGFQAGFRSETVILPQAVVHLLTIPAGSPQIQVAVTAELKTVADWARDSGAIAVLNGGFFDPQNGQTTSFITVDSAVVADPRSNVRLMDNPSLAPYLESILNRSEFRRLDCGSRIRYSINFHSAAPEGCTVVDAVGAGPQLLPADTAAAEGFVDFNAAGEISRDALGSRSPNARSAVGIKANGDVIWAMVAQRPTVEGPSGMTLQELADFLQRQGAVSALNLDGGSSASFYLQGETHYGKLDADGKAIQRPVKSVLMLAGSLSP